MILWIGQLFRRTHAPAIRSLGEPGDIRRAIDRQRALTLRTGAEFSLVLFRARRARRAPLSSHRLAKVLLHRARSTDEVGWFDNENLCLLLPATGHAGASRVVADIRALLTGKLPLPLFTVCTYPSNWFCDSASRLDAAPQSTVRGGIDIAVSARSTTADRRAESKSRDDDDDNHSGNGHATGGNGHNGHSMGGNGQSGNAGGNGGVATAVSRVSVDTRAAAAADTFQAVDLLPDLLRGVESELEGGALTAGALERLLARPLPLWKRAIDIFGAVAGLILTAPLFLLIAILVKFTSPGPAIFFQPRAGLGGKPFRIFKFRTMINNAEAGKALLRQYSEQDGPAFKIKSDPRITAFGRLLRSTSLDELPQLWNALIGDMSLVGPRPLPMDETDASAPWHRMRLDVTPGITCVWQVEGRSRVTFAEWMRMDMGYIRHRTLWTDLKILVATVPAVILRRGAC